MKILVFGAGVLGSYYATRLHQAGMDVTILARGEKYQNIKEQGIVLEDYFSHEKIIAPVKVIEKPEPNGYDLVMIFVQMIQVESVIPILAEIKSAKSFLFLGNNVIGFDKACRTLGKERVLAGFGAVGGKRDGHTVLFADADPKKPDKKGPIIIGELNGIISERIQEIKKTLEIAKLKVDISKDIDGWLKTHAAIILGMAGAVYKVDLNTKKLVEDKNLIYLIIRSMKEAIKVLESLKITIEPSKYKTLKLYPNFLLYRIFKKFLGSEFVAIGLVGHAQAARSEMKALSEGFLKLAEQSSVRIDSLRTILGYI